MYPNSFHTPQECPATSSHVQTRPDTSTNNAQLPHFPRLGNVCELTTQPYKIDFGTGEFFPESSDYDHNGSRHARLGNLALSGSILMDFYGANPPIKANGWVKRHRTCDCHRVSVSGDVSVYKSSDYDKSFYGGLSQCGNVWTCPVCSLKINQRKGEDLRQAADLRGQLGLHFSLLTLTAPHTAADKIGDLVPRMNSALSRFWRGRLMDDFKKRYGIKGHIRAFEVRHGVNGWHPHYHIIIVSRRALPSIKRKLKPLECQHSDCQWIKERWATMAMRAGLNCPNDYGVDLQNGAAAGNYISKFAEDGTEVKTKAGKIVRWDMSDELTKSHIKKSGGKSLSPFQLLAKILESEEESEKTRLKGLFLEYARAFQGVSQLRWSKGLRAIFNLQKEKTDEQIVEDQEDKAKLVARLEPKEWAYILKTESRSLVLQLTETGGPLALSNFLCQSVHKRIDFDAFYSDFCLRLAGPS